MQQVNMTFQPTCGKPYNCMRTYYQLTSLPVTTNTQTSRKNCLRKFPRQTVNRREALFSYTPGTYLHSLHSNRARIIGVSNKATVRIRAEFPCEVTADFQNGPQAARTLSDLEFLQLWAWYFLLLRGETSLENNTVFRSLHKATGYIMCLQYNQSLCTLSLTRVQRILANPCTWSNILSSADLLSLLQTKKLSSVVFQ